MSSEWRPTEGRFYKMTGSGNDFVFFDARDGSTAAYEDAAAVQGLCRRGTGIGADGVVVLTTGGGPEVPDGAGAADVAIRYYNADGTRASLCGNATLCTVALAVRLGLARPDGFVIGTDAGPVRAQLVEGLPAFELPPVADAEGDLRAVTRAEGEERLGYVTVGVPHVVVRVPDVDSCDVTLRGRSIRNHPSLVSGANVNFVARCGDGWRIRTFERGVEAETLACGTGSVASAVLLTLWGEARGDVVLETRSGEPLRVSLAKAREPGDASWRPVLSGQGRLVYIGYLPSARSDA